MTTEEIARALYDAKSPGIHGFDTLNVTAVGEFMRMARYVQERERGIRIGEKAVDEAPSYTTT